MVNTYQQVRKTIQGLKKDLQENFLKSKEDGYRGLADLLIAQGRLPEAEQVIRLLKEEEYFEFVRRDGKETLPGRAELTPEEAKLVEEYNKLADRVTAIGTEIGSLRAKPQRTPSDEQRLAELERERRTANRFFQKFLDRLADELGTTKQANDRIYQVRELQSLAGTLKDLGAGTVALYTLVTEEKYRVILITAYSQKAAEYPITAADLNKEVQRFRDVLTNPRLDPRPLAKQLYDILVAPIAKDLVDARAQTLMWSLDGTLRYLPVAALYDGEKYLVERYRNDVFTLASMLNLKDQPKPQWKGLGLGVSKARAGFDPLPAVPAELRAVIRDEAARATDGGILPGRVLLDEQFTEEAMRQALQQGYALVHIASHFHFHPGNETDSFLLLGQGQLTLAQLRTESSLFEGVDLLSLSACDTAMSGAGADGKEVEGFGVLTQRQGAKAVLATLWPVADESTQLLMRRFYRLRNAQPEMTKAEALREAQLALLRGIDQGTAAKRDRGAHPVAQGGASKGPPAFQPDTEAPFAHPYYWAPFILIGNWR